MAFTTPLRTERDWLHLAQSTPQAPLIQEIPGPSNRKNKQIMVEDELEDEDPIAAMERMRRHLHLLEKDNDRMAKALRSKNHPHPPENS
jgi:hypothetical protein